MRLLKIIAVVGVVGLAIGFTYFAFFKPEEYPKPADHPYLKLVVKLATTQYKVGEEITVKLYLNNTSERYITVFSGHPLLFLIVSDARSRYVLSVPEVQLPILKPYDLVPGVPHREVYTFALDKPGRYKLVAWTDFGLDEAFGQRLRMYARPVWIRVVTGSN